MTTNPYTSLTANTHTCVNSWAPSHQTNSNMRKCPSGKTYKYHFPITPGNWRSLPYGTPRQGLPQCSQQRLAKELAKEIPEAKWEVWNIHNHPYQTAIGSGQHSRLTNLISYPMTTLKPKNAQTKQVPCWLTLTNLIIIVIPTQYPKTAPAKT